MSKYNFDVLTLIAIQKFELIRNSFVIYAKIITLISTIRLNDLVAKILED